MRALVPDAEWDPRADYDLSEVERETKKAMDSHGASVRQARTLRIPD